jgi:hypothetical protein
MQQAQRVILTGEDFQKHRLHERVAALEAAKNRRFSLFGRTVCIDAVDPNTALATVRLASPRHYEQARKYYLDPCAIKFIGK